MATSAATAASITALRNAARVRGPSRVSQQEVRQGRARPLAGPRDGAGEESRRSGNLIVHRDLEASAGAGSSAVPVEGPESSSFYPCVVARVFVVEILFRIDLDPRRREVVPPLCVRPKLVRHPCDEGVRDAISWRGEALLGLARTEHESPDLHLRQGPGAFGIERFPGKLAGRGGLEYLGEDVSGEPFVIVALTRRQVVHVEDLVGSLVRRHDDLDDRRPDATAESVLGDPGIQRPRSDASQNSYDQRARVHREPRSAPGGREEDRRLLRDVDEGAPGEAQTDGR